MTGVALTTWAEVRAFAAEAAKSEMVPKAYRGRPADIALAIQLGSEIGLGPMQSVQNIAVIGGRPSIYGDAMLALCRRDRRCLRVTEAIDGDGDARCGTCVVERAAPDGVVERISSTFSVGDAKRAHLWGRPGPWTEYSDRMLQMRARGFALRDAFPDLLRGLISAEEAADIPVREPWRMAVEAPRDEGPLPASEAEAVGQGGADTEDQGERGPGIVQTSAADESPYVIYGMDGKHWLQSGPEWLSAWQKALRSLVERYRAAPAEGADALGRALEMNQSAFERLRRADPTLVEEVGALARVALQELHSTLQPSESGS